MAESTPLATSVCGQNAAHSKLERSSGPKVTAVIVTYNRKDLLQQCLESIDAGAQRPDTIIIWNNNSSDGTKDMLATYQARRQDIRVHHSSSNLGGAGGFHHAMAHALDTSADWVWVMDDDCLPDPQCLASLIRIVSYPWRKALALLAAHVVWTDGREHPMNRVKPLRPKRSSACELQPIRACSFVSCLIATSRMREVGLPIAAFQLWLDDVEYTHRIARRHLALAVRSACVTHATTARVGTHDAPPERAQLFARNWRWMMRQPKTFTANERPALWLRFVYSCLCMIMGSSHKMSMARALYRGWCNAARSWR